MIRFALLVASALGFVLMAALGNLIVPLKNALKPPEPPAQPEPEADETPAPDALAAPPPILGGLSLMVAVLVAVGLGWTAACAAESSLLGSGLTSRLLIALGGALLFGGVGAADDLIKMRRRSPLGLHRGVRFLLEAIAAALVLALLAANGWLATGFTLPFAGYVELGGAAPFVWGLTLIALSECARLAAGADGAVCGAAFLAMLGLMFVLTLFGWFALAVLPAAIAGTLMAFLLWNFPPAKLTPGASGCLFAAGAMGCIPLCIGWPELAWPLALPFWLEGGMVALQIVFCRLSRGRLLFCTSPLHRWLEKRGMSKVGVFYVLCALALAGTAGCCFCAMA